MGWVGVIDGLPLLRHGPLLPETNMLGLVLLLSEEEPRLCTVAEETLREDCCADREKKNTQRKSTITANHDEVGICESECFALIILFQTPAPCLEEAAALC